mgnify:CR=1 FL=1
MITINGTPLIQAEDSTLLELLQKQNYRTERVAVELNGEIIPKAAFGQTVLKDGDQLEVVSFVGGG